MIVLMVVLAILLLPIMALVIGLKVEIGDSRELVTTLLSQQLQRDVRITGPIQLELSFSPAISVEGVEIANPQGFSEPIFASIRKASAQIHILPLISRHLEVEQILLDGFHLDLIKTPAAEKNWQLWGPIAASQPASGEPPSQKTERQTLAWQGMNYSFNIKQQILISDARISYNDQAAEAVLNWQLEQLTLVSLDSDTLAMKANGSMLNEPYALDSRWQLEPLLQGRAGAIQLTMQVADAKLALNGHLAPQPQDNSYLELELDWQNGDSITRLLGDDFAHLAPIKLATRLDGKPGAYSLSPIQASLAGSQLSGSVALNGHSPVAINGKLEIDQLDLSAWLKQADVELTQSDNVASQQPRRPVAQTHTPEAEELPLLQIIRYWLNQADADLSLSIGEVSGLAQQVSELSVGLKIEGEQLKAPLQAVIDDIRFSGNLKANIKDERLVGSVRLVAKTSPLDKLVSHIPMLAGSSGSIGRSVLRINAEGSKLAELIETSRLHYRIEDARLTLPKGTHLDINNATIEASIATELKLNVDGVLLDVPLSAQIYTSPLQALIQQQAWLVRMQVNSPAVQLNLNGELPSGLWQQGASLQLSAESPRIGLLAAWLGVNNSAQGEAKLKLGLKAVKGGSELDVSQLQVADSLGKLYVSWGNQQSEQGLLNIRSDWQRLDLSQLLALFPEQQTKPAPSQTVNATKTDDTFDIHLPLLPQGLAIQDADLAIGIDTLVLGKQHFEQIKLQAIARDGWLQNAPFSGEFAQSKIAGNVSLDLRRSPLRMDFSIASDQPKVGQLLKQLNIAEQVDLSLERAELDLSLSGDNAAQLLASTRLSAKLIGGYWHLVDPNTQARASVALNQGSLTASPQQPLRLSLTGQLKQLPLALELNSLSLAEFTQRPSELPIDLQLNIDKVELSAQATLPRPISANNLRLAMQLSSPSLNQLDNLHGIQLPPFGPIKLSGELHIDQQGYALNKMALAVATSELSGSASLITAKPKPQLAIALRANNIQLDDFKLGDWQGLEQTMPPKPSQGEARNKHKQESVDNAALAAEAPQALLSQAVLRRVNADFALDVARVKSGEDWLGEGKLHWQLNEGRLNVALLWLALPGGEIKLSAQLNALDSGFYSEIKADIDNFDYGLLARRIKPGSEMNGHFNLHLDVNSRFEQLSRWPENANGQVGFAVWPEQFEAGIMDFWVVSLANAVVPKLDDEEQSVLNCVVAAFDSHDGQLAQSVLLADTSRMRVLGETEVDFKQQQLSMLLRPKAKRAQIFGLATPVQVSGSFDDFKVGIARGGLIGTTLRFVTSPVVSPLRWLIEAPLEADGSELCRQAWQQAKLQSVASEQN